MLFQSASFFPPRDKIDYYGSLFHLVALRLLSTRARNKIMKNRLSSHTIFPCEIVRPAFPGKWLTQLGLVKQQMEFLPFLIFYSMHVCVHTGMGKLDISLHYCCWGDVRRGAQEMSAVHVAAQWGNLFPILTPWRDLVSCPGKCNALFPVPPRTECWFHYDDTQSVGHTDTRAHTEVWEDGSPAANIQPWSPA